MIGTNGTQSWIYQEIPKKQARPSTRYLRDKNTNDESRGSIEDYPLKRVVEPNKILPQGNKGSHVVQLLS